MDDMKRSRRAYYWTPVSEDKPSIWRQILWAIDGLIPRKPKLIGHSRVMPYSMPSCSWWVQMPPQKTAADAGASTAAESGGTQDK